MRPSLKQAVAVAALLSGCSSGNSVTTPSTIVFTDNPCLPAGTVQLAVATTALADCSNGGATVTLAGNGASYMVVAELASEQGGTGYVPYSLASGSLAAANAVGVRSAGRIRAQPTAALGQLPPMRPMAAQRAFDRELRAQDRLRAASIRAVDHHQASIVGPPPPLGSERDFQVLASFSANTWQGIGARLQYIGDNVLLYVDTLAPAGGLSAGQLQSMGQYYDQTLFPIDLAAFGTPSDIDANGRVIMVMSPVVNGDTPASQCATQGYVAGFFDGEDFASASDPHSNQGEVFYTVVPDPNGQYSCAHSTSGVENDLPPIFLHEFQHLINYSQHVVVEHADPLASGLDEGLSLMAEELGSLYYEVKCPPPSCRASASQIFPDSSETFVQNWLYDSYQYAYLPDTASVTLHTDSDNGFSWRGGEWLLMRWLVDQRGTGVLRQLETGPSDAIAALEAAGGRDFPSLFADFGLAMYTDSLPGLARTTAPSANRFTSRNVRQLWARLYATSGGASDIPVPDPVYLYPITADTSALIMNVGTMAYFRLDTPANQATVTVRFSQPGGAPLPSFMRPQLAIFRLPPGQ